MDVINTLSALCFLCVALVSAGRENSCAIYSGGCAFHVVLAGANCARETPLTSAYTQLQGDDPKALYGYQVSPSENEINKEQLQLDKFVRDELETNSKRLTELENKLTKMMEGLSVRSLRHFRKIKTDMGAIMHSVNTISRIESGNSRRARSHDKCPEDFVTTGTWDSCYRFANFNSTWNEAKEFCGAMNANLVAIETEKEAYIIDGLIRSNPDLQVPKGWWTAGNYQARSGQWVWVNRRNVRSIDKGFTRWDKNEPNARSVMHCMILYRPANYLWHDGTCTDNHNFICEVPTKH